MSALRLEGQGSPKGWKRALYRAPILLYRLRLGFLFGKRLIMLEHTGRRSGRLRRAVIEVVVNDPDAVYIAAAWGEKSQWYANVRVNPTVTFFLGAQKHAGTASEVTRSQAEDLMSRYAAAHPVALDKLAAFILDDPADTPEAQAHQIAENVPFVRLTKSRE